MLLPSVTSIRAITSHPWRYLGSHWAGGEGKSKLQGKNSVQNSLRERQGLHLNHFDYPSPPRTAPGSPRMIALEDAATPVGDVADKITIKHLCYKHRNMALELHAQHMPGPIQRQKGFLNGYQTIRRLFYSPHLTRLR